MEKAEESISSKTDQSCEDEKTTIDKVDICIAPTLTRSKDPDTKAIVSLTQKRRTAETIAHARPPCPIILLTECPSIAKRLQLWRNVNAMVYVNCDDKKWEEKRDEMMQIAGLFGKEMNFFEADELLVTCCYTEPNCKEDDTEILQ